MRVRNLAAAIILQAIEDLWSPVFRRESGEFFAGEAFTLAAGMAGMSCIDQSTLLRILERNGILGRTTSFLPDHKHIRPALVSYN